MAETIEKISGKEIRISEPITRVEVFNIESLTLDKSHMALQISGVTEQLRLLRLKEAKINELIQKAKDAGVEIIPV